MYDLFMDGCDLFVFIDKGRRNAVFCLEWSLELKLTVLDRPYINVVEQRDNQPDAG